MIRTRKQGLRVYVVGIALLCISLAKGQQVPIAGSETTPSTSTDQRVIVALGAPGREEYGAQFAHWAEQWKLAAAHADFTWVEGDRAGVSPKSQIQSHLNELIERSDISEIWLVLIGHGTFDGKRAKFNLRGKDLDAAELSSWLKPLKQRLVIVNCASSSSPFINSLSGPNRIVVSSTRSGYEYNFSRFGGFLASSIADVVNDLDKDGQTSLLEAFCSASQSVSAAYQEDNRLATEHALIDDNGDGLGTPADWFEGIRTIRQPKQGIADGLAANQVFLKRRGLEQSLTPELRSRRDALESRLERLRGMKTQMNEQAYLARIEPILIELAKLYEQASQAAP